MDLRTHDQLRKTGATFLVAVLLMVHAVRLLHTHPFTTCVAHHADTSIYISDPGCVICQFEFFREVMLPDMDYHFLPLVKHVVRDTALNYFCGAIAPLHSSYRGPPAYAL